MPQFSADQEATLAAFGLGLEQLAAFASGDQVATDLHAVGLPIVAVVQKIESRVRCGIVLIHDPGGGVKSLVQIQNNRHQACQSVRVCGG